MNLPKFRVGMGTDIHPVAHGDSTLQLKLGGVVFPGQPGLVGHSDGDVVIHALIDALLGAAGMGDIGEHFPDTDPQWKGADSLRLLENVVSMLRGRSAVIQNVDITVHARAPRLGKRKSDMAVALARALQVDLRQINIKGKSDNGLGETGRGEAIAAQAIALLQFS